MSMCFKHHVCVCVCWRHPVYVRYECVIYQPADAALHVSSGAIKPNSSFSYRTKSTGVQFKSYSNWVQIICCSWDTWWGNHCIYILWDEARLNGLFCICPLKKRKLLRLNSGKWNCSTWCGPAWWYSRRRGCTPQSIGHWDEHEIGALGGKKKRWMRRILF